MVPYLFPRNYPRIAFVFQPPCTYLPIAKRSDIIHPRLKPHQITSTPNRPANPTVTTSRITKLSKVVRTNQHMSPLPLNVALTSIYAAKIIRQAPTTRMYSAPTDNASVTSASVSDKNRRIIGSAKISNSTVIPKETAPQQTMEDLRPGQIRSVFPAPIFWPTKPD